VCVCVFIRCFFIACRSTVAVFFRLSLFRPGRGPPNIYVTRRRPSPLSDVTSAPLVDCADRKLPTGRKWLALRPPDRSWRSTAVSHIVHAISDMHTELYNICLSVRLSVCLSVCLCPSLVLCLSLSLSLSVQFAPCLCKRTAQLNRQFKIETTYFFYHNSYIACKLK